MSKRVKIILYSITGFFTFLYILVGSIAYYCVFNTKINWEEFIKKFGFLAALVSPSCAKTEVTVKAQRRRRRILFFIY